MPTTATPRLPASTAPMSFFARDKVLRMLGITARQINRWERLCLVEPQLRGDERVYSFADLVSLRTIKQLTSQGLPARRLQHALEALRQREGRTAAPLAQLRIIPRGGDIAVEDHGLAVDAFSGQILLRFEDSQDRVEAIPERSAEEWFALALSYEGRTDLRSQAIDAYRHAVEAAPAWVEPCINLGTLLYEHGDLTGALEYFRRALARDPDNPLVHFNLGTALDELRDLRAACDHLRMAVRLRPDFADAHYNLARVYEELGEAQLARPHWRRYLDFDPCSSWAQFARQRVMPSRSRRAPISLE